MIDEVKYKKTLLAIIVPKSHKGTGIEFLTPNRFSQQLAYMHHPKGKIIFPHVHNPVFRSMKKTLEVLYIRKGKVRIDFYASKRVYAESRVLVKGDVVMLVNGGHGFTMLGDVEMIEIKQGPYTGRDGDKTRFTPIAERKIRIK